MSEAETIVGVILAGGRSRRMGVDKAFVSLGGRPLIVHVVGLLRPQVDAVVISANGDPGRFAALGFPVVADSIDGFAGPLAGMLAGLDWAVANRPEATWIVTVPADTPFIPDDLVNRLTAAASAGAIAVARSASGIHPVVAAIPLGEAEALRQFIRTGGSLKVADWLAHRPSVIVDFPFANDGTDPFFNVNTPEDLKAAEGMRSTGLRYNST